MASQGPKRIQDIPQKLTLFDRFFLFVEKIAYTRPLTIIFLSLVVAGLALWVTDQKLTFKTNRSDLVTKGLPYVEIYDNYREEFEDFDGMIVVVEDEDPAKMAAFADELAVSLKKRVPEITQIFYKIDTEYFRDKALLYMDREDLINLRENIIEHLDFLEKVNDSPGLNQFLESINKEISTGMVDAILSGFLGEEEGADEGKDEKRDLSLLIATIKQMVAYVNGQEKYRSPWKAFFSSEEGTLAEKGYLVTDDESLLYLLLVPGGDGSGFTGYKDTTERVRQVIEDTRSRIPVQAGLTGEDVISTDEMVTTEIDVRRASQIALAGVTILFILAYRGVVKPLLAVFSLVVALCWAMGYTTLSIGHLNILSIVFTTILIGLGIDFGIHILERYKEERMQGNDVLPALEKTVRGTGRGNFAGAITTAMAFGGMAFTDFIGIVELGIICAGGIVLCMLSMVLLLPALVTIEEKIRNLVYRPLGVVARKNRFLESLFNHYYWILAVSLLLVVLASLSLKSLSFDYNLLNLQASGTEAVQYEKKILEKAKRSAWSAATIADSLEEARRRQRQLESLPSVGRVESVVSVIPDQQAEKIEDIKALAPVLKNLYVNPKDAEFFLPEVISTMKRILFKLQGREENEDDLDSVREAGKWAKRFLEDVSKTDPQLAEKRLAQFSRYLFADYREKIDDLRKNADPAPVHLEDIPADLRKRFVSDSGRYLLMVFPSGDIWDLETRKQFMTELRGIDPEVTGNAFHMFESTRLMMEGYIKGGIYAMVSIFLYILLAFKNLRTTSFILLPVVVGTIWTIGIMDWMDVRFNVANLVILPLIIGIGVVNGVHIVHRYREEPEKSVTVLSKSTGHAVVLSSLTTMIGFGSLMVADHQGIFSLGLVLTIGVGSCLVASVTVLPAILKLSAERGWKV